MKINLTADQLYALNDRLRSVLADLGWEPRSEDDEALLNDVVFEVAEMFFPGGDARPQRRPPLVLVPDSFADRRRLRLLHRARVLRALDRLRRGPS